MVSTPLSTLTMRRIALSAVLALVVSLLPSVGAGAQTPTCAGKPATMIVPPGSGTLGPFLGTPGDDVIVGTVGDDEIVGLGGNDTICGLGGADLIDAGAGNDLVLGGFGNDNLNGGPGNDRVNGGFGKDTVQGSSGNDRVFGGPHNDIMVGGAGNDRVSGGNGNDSCDRDSGERPARCSKITTVFYENVTVDSALADWPNQQFEQWLQDSANMTIIGRLDLPGLPDVVVSSTMSKTTTATIDLPFRNSRISIEGGDENLGYFIGESPLFGVSPSETAVQAVCCYIS